MYTPQTLSGTEPQDVFVGEYTGNKDMDPTVRLGDSDAEAQVKGMLQAMAQKAGRKFLVSWKGSKVPHGVRLLGYEIVWTQHGMVTARDKDGQSTMLGTYQRVVEWGGPQKDKHVLVIAVGEHIKALAG